MRKSCGFFRANLVITDEFCKEYDQPLSERSLARQPGSRGDHSPSATNRWFENAQPMRQELLLAVIGTNLREHDHRRDLDDRDQQSDSEADMHDSGDLR